MMGRWCEEESAKRRWRAADGDERVGRFGSELASLDSAVSAYSWLTLFLLLSSSFFFCLFICLRVCFLCVLLDEVLGLFI